MAASAPEWAHRRPSAAGRQAGVRPRARVGLWAASVRRGRRGGCVGAQWPGSGRGRARFGESSLLRGLVWLRVRLTRTSEKMVCPSGRPTGACRSPPLALGVGSRGLAL